MPFNGQMDKEHMVHIHNGVLGLHQKGWIPNFCINMDGTGRDYAEWNKSSKESQLIYGFTQMWKLNKAKLQRENKRDKPRNRLTYTEQAAGVRQGGGGGWGQQETGMEKGTQDEHWL